MLESLFISYSVVDCGNSVKYTTFYESGRSGGLFVPSVSCCDFLLAFSSIVVGCWLPCV